MSQEIEIEQVSKAYSGVPAIRDVSAAFPAGSFTTLLGPSGCGKTTLLRLIAGFENLDAGRILFGDRIIATPDLSVPPEKRDVGVVFQSYALWPHMSVGENIAYPLKLRGASREESRKAVQRAMDMVGLHGLEERRTEELSGGQRQRVALARCLVIDVPLILFDEPLANLDAHLRAHMVEVFRDIHQRVGATIVYVTHDQSEALALSDRICIMDRGRIVQSGRPEDVYRSPADLHVASFVGRGSIVTAERRADRLTIGEMVLPTRGKAEGDGVKVLLRSEHLRVAPEGLSGTVVSAIYRGSHYEIRASLDGTNETVLLDHPRPLAPGESVMIAVEDAWIIPQG